MGNAWYCKKCEEGKIKISKACINRVIDEETGEELSVEQQEMNKVRCADDIHSKRNGINVENFDELCTQLEKNISKRPILEPPCLKQTSLMACLEKNNNSILACEAEMNQYLECIDTFRIKRIKRHIKRERERKRVDIEEVFNN